MAGGFPATSVPDLSVDASFFCLGSFESFLASFLFDGFSLAALPSVGAPAAALDAVTAGAGWRGFAAAACGMTAGFAVGVAAGFAVGVAAGFAVFVFAVPGFVLLGVTGP